MAHAVMGYLQSLTSTWPSITSGGHITPFNVTKRVLGYKVLLLQISCKVLILRLGLQKHSRLTPESGILLYADKALPGGPQGSGFRAQRQQVQVDHRGGGGGGGGPGFRL